jgi:hypothetical protein
MMMAALLLLLLSAAHGLHQTTRGAFQRPYSAFVARAASPGDIASNDPRGVTGRYSVFAPNVTETVSVCEFRAELKKNLGAFRERGTVAERHARYQASSSYLDALMLEAKDDEEGVDS